MSDEKEKSVDPSPVEDTPPKPEASAAPVESDAPPSSPAHDEDKPRPDKSAEERPAPAPTPPTREAKKGGGRGLAALALIISLAAAGGTGYLWYLTTQAPEIELPEFPDPPDVAGEVERRVQPLARQLEELSSGSASELASMKRELERRAAAQEGVDRSIATVEETTRRAVSGVERRLGRLEGSLTALADTRSNVSNELALSETEYLMRAADERLRLFNDPAGAERALSMAMTQLQTVDDPSYVAVRQTLASHIQSLKQVDLPDRVALSGRLLTLARDSAAWPIDARRSLQVSGANLLTPEESDEGWWARFKGVLSSVVVVHREKETETVLLTLEEERLLRENMRLQLQVAQLAAVRGEQPLYEASIDAVSGWLTDYYEGGDNGVIAAREQLVELRGINLNPELPDISPALRQLSNIRSTAALSGSAPAPVAEGPAQ